MEQNWEYEVNMTLSFKMNYEDGDMAAEEGRLFINNLIRRLKEEGVEATINSDELYGNE
jgi:hypothetical protein